jgi:hypothetical protein
VQSPWNRIPLAKRQIEILTVSDIQEQRSLTSSVVLVERLKGVSGIGDIVNNSTHISSSSPTRDRDRNGQRKEYKTSQLRTRESSTKFSGSPSHHAGRQSIQGSAYSSPRNYNRPSPDFPRNKVKNSPDPGSQISRLTHAPTTPNDYAHHQPPDLLAAAFAMQLYQSMAQGGSTPVAPASQGVSLQHFTSPLPPGIDSQPNLAQVLAQMASTGFPGNLTAPPAPGPQYSGGYSFQPK